MRPRYVVGTQNHPYAWQWAVRDTTTGEVVNPPGPTWKLDEAERVASELNTKTDVEDEW